MSKSRDLNSYAAEYLEDYGFERAMVHYRRKLVLERLGVARPRTVLEVGCGAELVAASFPTDAPSFRKWVIVEPTKAFADAAKAANLSNVSLIERDLGVVGLLILDEIGGPPDYIILSCLLHEVIDPVGVLETARSLMDDASLLFADVPNARSMHRRLALAMSIIGALTDLTERNLSHQQHRVFTPDMFRQTVERAGLRVTASGGNFIKPFTHSQMEVLTRAFEAADMPVQKILDGLDKLGKESPEWAAEIFVEARKVA